MFAAFDLFALLLALAAVVFAWRLLTRSPMKAALLAAAIGALFALVIDADPGSYALGWGGLVFLLGAAFRSRRRRPLAAMPAAEMLPPRQAPREPPIAPPRAPPSLLDIAWDEAADLATGDSRVAAAHAQCDVLLARAADEPADERLAEWANLIRRRVPELVDAASAAMAESDLATRAALANELAEALARVGAEAEERLGARRREAHDRFTTLRTYIDNRTNPTREWL